MNVGVQMVRLHDVVGHIARTADTADGHTGPACQFRHAAAATAHSRRHQTRAVLVHSSGRRSAAVAVAQGLWNAAVSQLAVLIVLDVVGRQIAGLGLRIGSSGRIGI